MDTLSLRLALAGTLATAGGCMLRYDVDDLEPGAGDDGPAGLRIDGITPSVVYEGQGALAGEPGLVRGVPVVLRGSNFDSNVAVDIAGESFSMASIPYTVSADGHWLAFELRMPVDEERGEGEPELAVHVSRGDEEAEATLVHRLLPELVIADSGRVETTESGGVSVYSRVSLRGAVTAVGTRPVRLFGYAGIEVEGALSADGSGRSAGAGGCGGAEVAEDASCGRGSGGRGADAIDGDNFGLGGGGGGAFGTADAEPGAGDRGGGAGMPTSARVLVPMPPASQTPAGGGGGGRGALGLGGGPGGGSGGILELTSPGVIEIQGLISANGASAGPCEEGGGGGGGGGGSGGAILIRAGAGLITGPGSTLRATGGIGAQQGCLARGGDGGVGLIRVDRPDARDIDAEPSVVGGPAFLLDDQVITGRPGLSVTIRGAPGDYNVVIRGFDREADAPVELTQAIGTDTSSTVSLWAGHNELCVQADPLETMTYPESQNCVTVAYIP